MKKIKINENAKVHYQSENYFELIIKEDHLALGFTVSKLEN